MISELKGNYGQAYIQDCLKHMSRLPDKTYDLCFTDCPWGHDYQDHAQKPMGINQKAVKQERIPYDDAWKPEFHKQWFPEAQRTSHAQVVCVGSRHLDWWYAEMKPIGFVALIYKNGQGSTKVSRYSGCMLYLCFGEEDWWKHHKFHRNFYEVYIHNGFLRDNETELKHPSPKDFGTWYQMISDLNNKIPLTSVYDPFLGSGAEAEVCEALGIPWAGTEIMPEYANDIQLRIQKGMEYYKTRPLKLRSKQKTIGEMIL